MQADEKNAASATSSSSSWQPPRVPDSRLPGAEPLQSTPSDRKGAPEQPLVEEAEADLDDLSLLALWPVFTMIVMVAAFTVATLWYGPTKMLKILLQHLVPPRPNFGHMVAIWLSIVGCITLGIPILLLLLPVPTMMFGWCQGFTITATAELAAACVSFAIGRTIIQKPLRRFIDASRCMRIRRVLSVLEDDEDESLLLLILYRFMAMPMAMRNYGPSVLRVPMAKLVLSTVPHCLWSATVFATVGAALTGPAHLLRDGHKIALRTPQWQQVVGMLSAIASMFLFSWIAGRAYYRRVEMEERKRKSAPESALVFKASEEGGHYGTHAERA